MTQVVEPATSNASQLAVPLPAHYALRGDVQMASFFFISAARFYWENNNNNFSSEAQKTLEISLPVAVTVFPGEIYRAPRSWTERAYRNLIYFNEVSKGGHFAAWEQPELFAAEVRSAFRSLR